MPGLATTNSLIRNYEEERGKGRERLTLVVVRCSREIQLSALYVCA